MKKLLPACVLLILLFFGCAGKMHYTLLEKGTVTLYLKAPKAQTVEVLSSSTNYQAIRATRGKKGVWSVNVPANKPFDYFYLVDGEPFTPPCLLSRPDGFGGKTCIFDPAQ
ncbi:glycoside hydrolase [Desulfatibacillum aliphaticivorans]|uniref:Glycoside hydrolase family 13 domain protein n=1 Tax=Desulfatibacillum aliphaticivorans TaxID=218208 RepID=B8FLM4_DESAL|nr:glycoside hydrolase [Desulfatibacillum aliphaticivorans]ACL05378.1 glycoside hydrolase family 13 domain protein [Desulfatibacillum aliphaticivorans]